jgi:hypothetical protein
MERYLDKAELELRVALASFASNYLSTTQLDGVVEYVVDRLAESYEPDDGVDAAYEAWRDEVAVLP